MVREEEVGLEQAKLQDMVQVEVVDMAQAKLQDQVKEDWAEEQRMHEVEAVDVAKAREDLGEEHLVNFVENEADSKINSSDIYSTFYKKLHVLEVEEVYDPSRFLFHEQAEVDAVENGA